jgi:hypothetical protein
MVETSMVQGRTFKETSWGVPPASAMQIVNVRSIGLKRPRTVETPNVLRGDRRRYASVVLQESGGLSLPGLLQYGNHTAYQEGALGSTWSAPVTVTAITIAFTAGTNVIADSGNGLGSFQVGDFIYISGSAGNTKWHGPVTAAAAGSITVGSALVTEAAGPSVTLTTTRLIDGAVDQSYAFEYDHKDLAANFRAAKGLKVGQVVWNWQTGQFVEENYELIGQVPAMANATIGTGAATAAVTTPFMNALGNFAKIVEGGAASNLIISRLGITALNSAALLYGIGSTAGPNQVATPTFDVSVELSFYFDANGRLMQDKIEAHTTTSLYFVAEDSAGGTILWHLPSLKPDVGDPETGEAGNRVMGTAKLSASHNTTYNYQMAMFKRAAA